MKKINWIQILRIALLVVFVVAAFNIGKTYYDYGKADRVYNSLQGEYVVIAGESSVDDKANSVEEKGLDITIDFGQLLARNEDVVGWLYCPDTVLNYPVVKGENNDEYLHADLDGNYLKSGSLFVDYRSGWPGEDYNHIIYGHSMKNGTMFRMLLKYRDQAYYDAHPILYYLTPGGNYELELFAGRTVLSNDNIYSFDLTKEGILELAKEYQKHSDFKNDVALSEEDIIVTLSTCSYENDDARYIALGRLKEIDK